VEDLDLLITVIHAGVKKKSTKSKKEGIPGSCPYKLKKGA